MFSKNNKENVTKTSVTNATIIGAGTQLKGDLTCNNDLRIDGKLTGNIYCDAKVVIGSAGIVEGEINGQNADIMGKIVGNVKITELLNLRGQATIKGDIYTNKLQIEPEVQFNGSCHMGANVIGMTEKKTENLAKAK
jgi:cytoskeletal protein CcmA (bactofilin family)